MTMPDPRLKESVEEMLKDARPDQIKRLLADIAMADREPTPTHNATKRLQ